MKDPNKDLLHAATKASEVLHSLCEQFDVDARMPKGCDLHLAAEEISAALDDAVGAATAAQVLADRYSAAAASA